MTEFRGADVVVVGLGTSGLAATRVLRAQGARVRATEDRPRADIEEAARRAETAGAEVAAGGHRPEHLEGAELVVVSPGVPERAPVLRWARERRIPVWSELELGARLTDAPYLAVTGTNGKTTTTEMIASAMRRAGVDAVACGNIGHPFSVAATEGHEALVVEASSFQLRFHQTFHPRVSVLLNLAPDHLDWHGSLERYRHAKARIFELQGPEDVHVGNRDDPHAAAVSRGAPCPVTWFTLGQPRPGEAGFREGALALGGDGTFGEPVSSTEAHRADAAAALAATVAFGLDPEVAAAAIVEFPPLAHRGAVVAEVGGVRFVDDSKATNPHAALAALSSLDRAVLVAGGRSKGIDLSPLAAATPRLAGVVALGEAAPELERLFAGRVPVRRVSSIEDAVVAAHRMASPGDTVLLAPACASQDMFRDYRERGERFASAARRLQEVNTHA